VGGQLDSLQPCTPLHFQIDKNQMIVFGGLNKNERYNDLWALDVEKKEWQEIKIEGPKPEPRAHFTATLVQFKECIFIFGGYGGSGQVSILTREYKHMHMYTSKCSITMFPLTSALTFVLAHLCSSARTHARAHIHSQTLSHTRTHTYTYTYTCTRHTGVQRHVAVALRRRFIPLGAGH